MHKLLLIFMMATFAMSAQKEAKTNLRCDAFEVKFKSEVDCNNLDTISRSEDLKFCTKTCPLIIDGYALKKAVYIFHQNQLSCIVISVEGQVNCEGIFGILKEIYGKPFKAPNSETYIWDNKYISCWLSSGTMNQNKGGEIILAFKK